MRLLFDIETDGLLPHQTKPGEKPGDRVHSLVIKDIDSGKVLSYEPYDGPSIRSGGRLLEDADLLIGHNIIGFDLPFLKKVWPDFTPKAKLFDTLVASRLIFTNLKDMDYNASRKGRPAPTGKLVGSHSMEAWGIRLGVSKGSYGKTTDWASWSPEMQAYCEQDVEVNHTILRHIEAKNYSTRALDLEMDFATIIARQEQHGFAFDVNAAVKLQGVLQRRRDELKARLQETFAPRVIPMKTPAYWKGDVVELGTPYDSGWSTQQFATKAAALKAGARNIVKGPPRTKTIPFNPGSRLQIAERLSELHGWTPTEFTEDGQAKVDDVILGSLPYPEAKLLAEYLMVEKRIGQLAEGDEAWLKLERNGRIHGKVNTGGAVTGRCTHSNPNVAQVPSCGTKEDPVPYGPDCRSLFVASPGFVLVGCDAEGLELRGLSHFMAFYDGGAYGQAVVDGKKELGTDAHTLNQKAAGLSSRDVAKTFIYAFIYGAGDNKLGLITGVTPEEVRDFQVRYKSKWRMVAEREARQGFPSDPLSVARTLKGGMLRSKFLAGLPALRQLIDAVKTRAKESNRWIRGIDGRLLCVRSLHSCLNTLIQSAGAVVMKQALVFLYRDCLDRGWVWGRDFAFVANIHDEYQAEVRPEIAQDYRRLAAAAITRAGEAFGFRCRLDGSASEPGANWRDTH